MKKYTESETLELKAKYTESLCKEIVSFLNGSGGTILIGVNDDSKIIGIDKTDNILKKISDIITDQIEPNPQDDIICELQILDEKTIIAVKITKGSKHIYCQKKYGFSSKGCTVRIGTTCKEMTPEQINMRYEQNFIDTEYMLKKKSGLADLSFRELKIYYAENICISDTRVRPRKDMYLFDYDSVNEAVLNAFVHNDWTLTEPQISMFTNRLEILSHGGLPRGMTEKQFFDGISKPRNPTLMRIFLNMGLTEHTGHGIPTIVNRYGKEVFEIESNYIRCSIPFSREVLLQIDKDNVGLNKTERNVIRLLAENGAYSADELAGLLKVSRRTVERAFSALQDKGFIKRRGSKRDGSWIVIHIEENG
ncbi:putative DNA binding domain-containing protein [Treponema sp. OMZ 840]|uniref:RNA-binding domain-containing protein n=1 Tax=Treponema sp. OMZ 840 TaxID=244313 RepID=UPI003D8B010F